MACIEYCRILFPDTVYIGDVSSEPCLHRLSNVGTERPRNPEAVTEPGMVRRPVAAPPSRPTPRIHSPVPATAYWIFHGFSSCSEMKIYGNNARRSFVIVSGRRQMTGEGQLHVRTGRQTSKLNVATTAQWSRR